MCFFFYCNILTVVTLDERIVGNGIGNDISARWKAHSHFECNATQATNGKTHEGGVQQLRLLIKKKLSSWNYNIAILTKN